MSLDNKKSDTKGYQYVLTTTVGYFGKKFFIAVEINVIYIRCDRFICRKMRGRVKDTRNPTLERYLFFLMGFAIHAEVYPFISLPTNLKGKHFVVRHNKHTRMYSGSLCFLASL